jgi:hypothetical protein
MCVTASRRRCSAPEAPNAFLTLRRAPRAIRATAGTHVWIPWLDGEQHRVAREHMADATHLAKVLPPAHNAGKIHVRFVADVPCSGCP